MVSISPISFASSFTKAKSELGSSSSTNARKSFPHPLNCDELTKKQKVNYGCINDASDFCGAYM